MSPKLPPVDQLGFGLHFCPFMAESNYKGSWSPLRVQDLQPLAMHPASKVLHYAQEIFEGLKVFKSQEGRLSLFRPDMNIRRMTHSARVMAMPPFPEDLSLEAMKQLTRKCFEWIPEAPGALYLRPTMIATSTTLGVAPSEEYLFFVIASPVGGYFQKSTQVSIWISDQHIRATRGGLGSAKTGANYAASLSAVAQAKSMGYTNVLFLDALERRYLEELSGMNIFLVEDGVLKTPRLGDTILAGVTRDSVLKVASYLKIPTREDSLDVHEVLAGIRSGRITEAFACGTGASITPIQEFGYKGEKFAVASGTTGRLTTQIYDLLLDIQFGRGPRDFSSWLVEITPA